MPYTVLLRQDEIGPYALILPPMHPVVATTDDHGEALEVLTLLESATRPGELS